MKFVKITSIVPMGKQHVYDLSMKPTEDPSFIANGFIVHNSFAAAESAYSTFLETSDSYRSHLTAQLFYRRLFPLVAVVNGMYKDKSKAKITSNPLDFLFNANNSGNLKIPQVIWHKKLEAKTEDSLFDMLEKAEEKGVPIPLKMWMAAANIDKDTLLRDLQKDVELSTVLNSLKGEVHAPEGSEEFDNELESALTALSASRTRATSIPMSLASNRVGLGAREYNSHDLVDRTRTGKPKHVYNQSAKKKDLNARIVRIALRSQHDPHYRAQLKADNERRTGKSTLDIIR